MDVNVDVDDTAAGLQPGTDEAPSSPRPGTAAPFIQYKCVLAVWYILLIFVLNM